MAELRRGVLRTLALAFLLYLLVWPAWHVLQPVYTRTVIHAAGAAAPRLEYPVLTESLGYEGGELSVRSRAAAAPIGTWKDLDFAFYLPFILILILVFPGVPRRDRPVLAVAACVLLFVLHVALVVSVVEQVHRVFLTGKGVALHAPAVFGWWSFRRRVLFHFGNQLFSGATLFFLILRYGPGPFGPRPGRPAQRPMGWQEVRLAGIGLVVLLGAGAVAVLVHPILRRHSADYPGLQMVLGTLYDRSGRLPDAAAAFAEAARADPGNPLAHNNLGVVLGRLEEWEAARASLERAVAIDPDLAEANRALGVALLHLDRPCEAIEPLRRAQPFFAATGDDISPEFLDSVVARCRDRGSPGTPSP